MKKQWGHRDLDRLACAAIILFLFSAGLFVWFYNINQGYWWDEAVYLGLARNLYENGEYWINVPGQETFRPPAMPVLTAGVWSVTGLSEPAAKALPPLFGIGSVILIYFFAKRLYGRATALAAAALLATSHIFIFYSEKMLTETMFIFLSLAMLYALYRGTEEKRKWLLPVAGIFMALAFLTRYAGFLLVLAYVAYPFLRSGKKGLSLIANLKLNARLTLSNWGFWLGLVLAALLIAPWVAQNLSVYGDPLGAMKTGLGTVTSGFYLGDWYFYFSHWFEVFGLLGIFMVFGAAYLVVDRRNANNLMLILLVTSMLFFMSLPRKEARYLMHFLEIYFLVIAIGVLQLRAWLKSRAVIPLITIVFVALNLTAGIQMLGDDKAAGLSLKEAGLWLGERAPALSSIMTNNMPPIYYTSGRTIVYFPESQSSLAAEIAARNVSYLLIESREPTYPEWLWVVDKSVNPWFKKPSGALEAMGLRPEADFKENNVSYVWVYKAQ